MNISLNWLKEYLKIDLSVEKVCEILTSIGLEVGGYEKFESIRGGLRGLVIGEVKTCEAHPDSDHLHLTTVDLGDGRLTPHCLRSSYCSCRTKSGSGHHRDGALRWRQRIYHQKIKNQRTGIRRNDLCRR